MLNSHTPTHPNPRSAHCISLFSFLIFNVKAKSKKLPLCHTNGASAAKKASNHTTPTWIVLFTALAILIFLRQPRPPPQNTKVFHISFLQIHQNIIAKLQAWLSKLTRVRFASLKKSSFFFCPKSKRAKQKEYFLVCPCINATQPVIISHYV